MIVIATHAVFLKGKDIYGPPHAISLYLKKKKIPHIFIRHSLYNDYPSTVSLITERAEKTIETIPYRKKPLPLQYLAEIMDTVRIVHENKEPVEVFIGVDSLNVLAGLMLRMGNKVKKTVYVSADFAIIRFDKKLLNTIYHSLDSFAMRRTHATWSVSKRIVEYRKKKGLSKEKNMLLPNAPFFDDIKRRPVEKIRRNDLVLVSALAPGIAFETVINTVGTLRKKVKNIRLIIIGSGVKEKELKKIVKLKKLEKHVIFKGPMSHDDMFDVLVTCGIGIALYDVADPNHFRYFSDPMKVRDYLASGLPVIVSGNSGIGEEVEKKQAGYALQIDEKSLEKVVLKLLKNNTLYSRMRKNAIEMARNYDTYNLIHKHLTSL